MSASTIPGLTLSIARIERAVGDPIEKASINIRRGTATVKVGRGTPMVVIERSDVETVERVDSRHWQVTFADGMVWTVTRDKGCGCGGGR